MDENQETLGLANYRWFHMLQEFDQLSIKLLQCSPKVGEMQLVIEDVKRIMETRWLEWEACDPAIQFAMAVEPQLYEVNTFADPKAKKAFHQHLLRMLGNTDQACRAFMQFQEYKTDPVARSWFDEQARRHDAGEDLQQPIDLWTQLMVLDYTETKYSLIAPLALQVLQMSACSSLVERLCSGYGNVLSGKRGKLSLDSAPKVLTVRTALVYERVVHEDNVRQWMSGVMVHDSMNNGAIEVELTRAEAFVGSALVAPRWTTYVAAHRSSNALPLPAVAIDPQLLADMAAAAKDSDAHAADIQRKKGNRESRAKNKAKMGGRGGGRGRGRGSEAKAEAKNGRPMAARGAKK